MTKRTQQKSKSLEVSRANAYMYIATLLQKSRLFNQIVDHIRNQYDIKCDDYVSKNAQNEEDILKRLQKRQTVKTNTSHPFIQKKEFQKLVKDFFIHRRYWQTVLIYIFTGSASFALREIWSKGIGEKWENTEEAGCTVMRIFAAFPITIQREEYEKYWAEIQEMRNEFFNKKRIHSWDSAETFDRALRAYILTREGKTLNEVKTILCSEGYYKQENTIDDANIRRGRNKIEAQIKSMEYLDELIDEYSY